MSQVSARIAKDFRKNNRVYLMALPMVVFLVLFRYLPLLGISIAFQDFKYRVGFFGSKWVGLKHFESFVKGFYFGRLLTNTLMISLLDLAFVFPMPILLALLINEIRSQHYKRIIQTITYMPHFISIIVFSGIIIKFTSMNGVIPSIMSWLGMSRVNLLMQPAAFRSVYTISSIWKEAGWSAIIYLSAVTRVDPQLYEAADIDGSSRIGKLIHVTLPGIAPTVIMMLILKMGSMMNVGFERIILLYNDVTRETADVISTYVYRAGLIDMKYSFSTAVDFFNSIINFTLVIVTNAISRYLSDTSLW
ncbi:sugar ABC transporter permease [Clostridia bacterium]|nr:sugar ABC transporter permease [Clostridia bacterium]